MNNNELSRDNASWVEEEATIRSLIRQRTDQVVKKFEAHNRPKVIAALRVCALHKIALGQLKAACDAKVSSETESNSAEYELLYITALTNFQDTTTRLNQLSTDPYFIGRTAIEDQYQYIFEAVGNTDNTGHLLTANELDTYHLDRPGTETYVPGIEQL